jgi:hypothetical protein
VLSIPLVVNTRMETSMHMSWIAVIPFLWIHMMMTVTVRIVATAILEALQVIFLF